PQPARLPLGSDQAADAQSRVQQPVGADSECADTGANQHLAAGVHVRLKAVRRDVAESESLRQPLHPGQQLPGAADAAVLILTTWPDGRKQRRARAIAPFPFRRVRAELLM